MLSNIKSIKILECCSRQTLSLVENKYHVSCKKARKQPKQKKEKSGRIQPLGFGAEVIFTPALSEQGLVLTFLKALIPSFISDF